LCLAHHITLNEEEAMKKTVLKCVLTALVAGMSLPLAAHAADDDLQMKIDKLSKEVEELKGSVQKVEDKSIGKWLTIGGEYRFRVDSLHGNTAAYSDAIGTMTNLVGGFTGPTGVAGSNIGGITSPNATQFIMQGKAGALFTPAQFNTILNQYMPQAMAASLPGLFTAMNTPGFNPSAVPALTVQQSAILNTLSAKVLPTVMGMQVSTVPGLLALLPAGTPGTTTIGQVFSGLPPAQQQLATQMLMQGFLGAGSGNLKMIPAFKPKNETLYTNKFGLDLTAKATQDITVHAKLDMYKAFGSQSDQTTANGSFADRVGVFDGTLSHVPSNSLLNVDRAFATWSNILDQPLWFSIGRRPSTNGAPSNLRLNNERPGNGGTPALLVDYAFDGMTIGYAPDIEILPGAYAKVCYGRGFESGIKTQANSIKDTDMLGIAIIPVDTDPLRVWLQWNRGFNIFDFPAMNNTIFGNTAPATNLGSIDWYGAGAMSTLKKFGPGNLNFFTDFGMSVAHPGGNVSQNAGFQGLMSGEFFAQDTNRQDRFGWAAYAGVRYDLPSNTKIGFEFNHGSKNWITFAPAADDMWTAKVGTRGNVYEPYIIQELNLKPISSYLSKAFFKIGYQYYDFEYTGSNNWVGAPKKISEIQPTDLMLMTPVKTAHDIYGTFEVKF
jgi:opacity protein-like surface antigen